MGAKSRGNWSSGICLKDCIHQGKEDVCGACVRFSNCNKENPERMEAQVDDYECVAKYGQESMRFYPHYNAAFGKYISTKGEYLSEMKKGNFIPTPKHDSPPPRKEYKQSADTLKVIRSIRDNTDKRGNFTPSGSLKAELIKRKVIINRGKFEQYKQYTGN